MTPTRHLIRQPGDDTNARPFMVIWETTMACDLVCRHCRAEAMADHDPQTLSTEEGRQLLDQIEQFGKPRPIVVLTGGDPFKRNDIFELTAYGTEIGLAMAVSPSATPLLTYNNLAQLKTAGAKAISLSLDGSMPKIHDVFRGVRGSYQMTIDGWQAAQAIGLKVQLNTTITRHNLYDLPHIFLRALDYGVMTWSVFFLVPTGRGKLDDEITPAQYEDVMHWLYDASKFVRIKTTEGHHYKRIVLQRTVLEQKNIDPASVLSLSDTYHRLHLTMQHGLEERGLRNADEANALRRTPMHINAGDGFVFISKRGDVFPSGFMPLSAGNVRHGSLVDIYRHAPLFQQLRQPENFDGRCGVCEFRKVCGGSRSRAYAVTGNPLAEEPFCTYEPGSFPYQREIAALL
ncbi:MAG: TIGR04053 family radical SAM/SPASM domain-containing protein [Anaerolineae bacterium]|nr:TIGR04053 family radical SAM/SPASM domain-containing protein [Anaerolineae bacterium]